MCCRGGNWSNEENAPQYSGATVRVTTGTGVVSIVTDLQSKLCIIYRISLKNYNMLVLQSKYSKPCRRRKRKYAVVTMFSFSCIEAFNHFTMLYISTLGTYISIEK